MLELLLNFAFPNICNIGKNYAHKKKNWINFLKLLNNKSQHKIFYQNTTYE